MLVKIAIISYVIVPYLSNEIRGKKRKNPSFLINKLCASAQRHLREASPWVVGGYVRPTLDGDLKNSNS